MKKLLLIFIISTALEYPQELPFRKGVNITNWFQASSPQSIQFNKYAKRDFERIKSLGADVIRLPINLHFMTGDAPEYTLDPLFLYLIDQVVDWAEEVQINLILDNHTFDVNISTSTDIDQVLIPVWTQMAERYKDRSKYIFYEILNEPHGILDYRWNEIQLSVLNTIREIDTVHTIIVGPANWNSYNNLSLMPQYPDSNLIYTFHFYDPFIFTHQGASWTDPSLVPLGGVPFPYNSSVMPVCPDTLRGTWVENVLNNYINDGTETGVKNLINIADNFQKSRNVKLLCGELGVLMYNAPDSDRTYWYGIAREYLESKNIAWTIWDYKGGFGLFEKDSYELFDYDLNIPLVKNLGFNEPPQQDYVLKPDSAGFDIYTDDIGENILGYGSGTTGFWNTADPQSGNFAIYWTGAPQYNTIYFSFKPIRDLSRLLSEGYMIDFFIKGSTEISLDIRFIDTKEGESDHPWRIRYNLDISNVEYDGIWQHLQIPLKDFTEQGSWDNDTWYIPEGKFDWAAIDRFEIVSEYGDLGSAELWFDEIKILNPEAVYAEKDNINPAVFSLYQNYPNPFNPSTKIKFSIPTVETGHASSLQVTLKVYDILGKEIAMLVNEEKTAGNFEVIFNGNRFSSGIYFYRLQAGGYSQTRKMILLK